MPIHESWFPGSRSWANADGLKNFLIGSGRGIIIKIGSFKELTSSSENLPIGAVGKLSKTLMLFIKLLPIYNTRGRNNFFHFPYKLFLHISKINSEC